MERYPILALRDSVLFPDTAQPLAVGRESSVKLLEDVAGKIISDGRIVIMAQRQSEKEDPRQEDLYDVGTVAEVVKVLKLKDNTYSIVVKGIYRVRLLSLVSDTPYLSGDFEPLEDIVTEDAEEQALFLNLKNKTQELAALSGDLPKETDNVLLKVTDFSKYCDFLIANMDIGTKEKQRGLEMLSLKERSRFVIENINALLEVRKLSEEISNSMEQDSKKVQRDYFLRQQMKAIKDQLGEEDDLTALEERVYETMLPEEVMNAVVKQLNRLRSMQSASSEFSVTLGYVETLLDIPWCESSEDNLDLTNAQEVLDGDHYGLDKVKNRVIEHLAVLSLKGDLKSPILCLSGPPGVGKTSIGKSIATALGRKFVRISLGGVADESEIRGHRRTYIGAMPGRIAKAMIKAGTNNPVILLDEIDKMGSDYKGDPSSAMLEVLDPEQNSTFSDHYVEVPLDLSNVLFIATANSLHTISAPLRDRMEIIEVPSYTSHEKKKIAQGYLIPKQVKNHGITEENLTIATDGLEILIDKYTREAGVRSLERRVADVCRSVAVDVAKLPVDERNAFSKTADASYVVEKLGPPRYHSEIAQRTSTPGVATGLAWTSVGGEILFIETTVMDGEGKVQLTGQLGDVMKESVYAALSYIRSHAYELGVDLAFVKGKDIHVHVPAGAIPKDGPSAGVTMFSAIVSALTSNKICSDIAMTGEVTLQGNVLPVGGIREKVTAAHRAGIKRIVIPSQCEKDLVDITDEIRNDLEFFPVSHVRDLMGLVFEDPIVPIALSVDANGDSTSVN